MGIIFYLLHLLAIVTVYCSDDQLLFDWLYVNLIDLVKEKIELE